MAPEIVIRIGGDVVSHQELLNGTESVTLDGRSADGKWAASFEFSWNRGLVDADPEGDITLGRDDGAELFGSLVEARVSEAADGELTFDLRYELDGGSGAFDQVLGSAQGAGSLGGGTFQSQWRIDVTDAPAGS